MLLLKEVLKFTSDSHPDFQACNQALTKLENVGQLINEARRQFENGNRFLKIASLADVPLMEAHRKLLEEYPDLMTRTTKVESPGEIAPFEKRTILLCSDSLIILRRPDADQSKFIVVNLLSFGENKGTVLTPQAGADFFTICNVLKSGGFIHAIRVEVENDRSTMIEAIESTILRWREDSRLFAQEDAAVEKLKGLVVQCTGTVPVAPQGAKPYTLFMLSISKDGEPTRVILKRYQDLLALHKRMIQIYGESTLPKFPYATVRESAKGQSQRENMAAVYLNTLVAQQDVLKVPEVRRFLTTTDAAEADASTGATTALSKSPRGTIKSPRRSASNKSPRFSGGASRNSSSPMISAKSASVNNVADVVSVFATDKDIYHEGWLTKKGHKRRNWKRRWMILADGEINYYAKKGASEPKGSIDLLQPGISAILMGNSQASNFRFMIITPDQIFPLYADSHAEREQWMITIANFGTPEDEDNVFSNTPKSAPLDAPSEAHDAPSEANDGESESNSRVPSYIA